MVIDAIIAAIANTLSALFDALPDYNLPSDVTVLPELLTQVFQQVGKLGMWFPLSTIASMGTALFAAFGISLAVRLVRFVIGYIPTMGGSQQ